MYFSINLCRYITTLIKSKLDAWLPLTECLWYTHVLYEFNPFMFLWKPSYLWFLYFFLSFWDLIVTLLWGWQEWTTRRVARSMTLSFTTCICSRKSNWNIKPSNFYVKKFSKIPLKSFPLHSSQNINQENLIQLKKMSTWYISCWIALWSNTILTTQNERGLKANKW